MALEEALETGRGMLDDPDLRTVSKWKEDHPGKKAFGSFPVYVPSELIHAAGMLPVGLFGGGDLLEIDHADSRMQSFVCSISRSTLELGLKGHLKEIDGMVFPNICDVARNLSGVWVRNFPEMTVEYLHLPQNMYSKGTLDYIVSEFSRLMETVGRLNGTAPTDDDLRNSIEVFNRNRAALRELYRIKRENPWLLSTAEAYVLTRMGLLMDRGEHTAIVNGAIEEVEAREAKPMDKIRVIVEGAFCEQPPLEFLEVLEEAGCYILDDDLVVGHRWYEGDVPLNGNAIRSLAEAYINLSKSTSVRHAGAGRKQEHLVRRCRDLDVDGVIFVSAKFCEPALYDYVLFKEAMEREDIPYLTLEYEEKMGTFESVRTQAETFVESILFD